MAEMYREPTGSMQPTAGFKSIQDEAEWWDKQSPMENVPDEAIGVRRAGKTETITVRFDPQDLAEIREEAAKHGMGPTTLIRAWVREHLRQRPHAS